MMNSLITKINVDLPNSFKNIISNYKNSGYNSTKNTDYLTIITKALSL